MACQKTTTKARTEEQSKGDRAVESKTPKGWLSKMGAHWRGLSSGMRAGVVVQW